jgi:hypothetical protein
METLGDKLVTKNEHKTSDEFYCDKCDYKCGKKFNWDRHILTPKHTRVSKGGQKGAINEQNEPGQVECKYSCESCKKNYASRNGLWKHQQKCSIAEKQSESVVKNNATTDKDELINYLMKENQEFKNLILEIVKKDTYNQSTTNNTTNNTNSHNKAFNLNFFLNETCKDAMNIMDFVDSIKLQLSDLEKVGELGYVEGISNIIVKNLNELDVTQRPVHCTDKKRETMYIKDEDKWEKDEANSKIKKAIKRVASKNQRLLPKFKEAHPDCGTYHSKYSDQYNKIIIESVGGSGDNDAEKEEKIIRNISKNVVVDKGPSL